MYQYRLCEHNVLSWYRHTITFGYIVSTNHKSRLRIPRFRSTKPHSNMTKLKMKSRNFPDKLTSRSSSRKSLLHLKPGKHPGRRRGRAKIFFLEGSRTHLFLPRRTGALTTRGTTSKSNAAVTLTASATLTAASSPSAAAAAACNRRRKAMAWCGTGKGHLASNSRI